MLRKILIVGALFAATLTGGALGSSFMGVASAQTDDATTTTAPAPSDSDTEKDRENCPEKDGGAADSSDTTAS